MHPAGQQHMPRLSSKKRDRRARPDGDTANLAGVAANPAWQINRDNRYAGAAFMASITVRGRPSTGRSRPAPNSASTITFAPARLSGSGGLGCAAPGLVSLRRIAFEPVTSPASSSRVRYWRSCNTRAATKSIPAIVAGPSHDSDVRSSRPGCDDRVCDRRSGMLHEREARRPIRDGQPIRRGHFGVGEELDHRRTQDGWLRIRCGSGVLYRPPSPTCIRRPSSVIRPLSSALELCNLHNSTPGGHAQSAGDARQST